MGHMRRRGIERERESDVGWCVYTGGEQECEKVQKTMEGRKGTGGRGVKDVYSKSESGMID